MKPITIGIADDHPIVIFGVLGMLEECECSDMHVRFTAECIQSLLELVQAQSVDVLLCDYEFADDPEGDGLALLAQLRRLAPRTKVLFLSIHLTPCIVAAAFDGGAAGFIGKKRADMTSLPEAIREVSRGNLYVPPSLASGLLSAMFGSKGKETWLPELGVRELIVARMISDGLSIGQIAKRLDRSPRTISNQKNAAMKKLGVRNDIELAAMIRDMDGGRI